MQDRKLVKNMVGSMLCRPLSVLLSLAYYPVALHYLGDYRYGVWTTLVSLMSWITYFDIGLGHGLRNHLTEALERKDGAQYGRELVSSAYILLSALVGTALAVILLIAGQSDVNSWLGAADYAEDLFAVFAVCAVSLGVNFIFSLNQSIWYALQQARVVPFMGVTQQALVLIGTLMLRRRTEANLLQMAVVYGGACLLNSAIYAVILFLRHPELRPTPKCYSREAAGRTTDLGLKFFVIQIAGLILFSTDNLIITNLFGPEQVTVYSTTNKVFMLLITTCNALMAPLWSAFTGAQAKREWPWIRGKIRQFWMLVPPLAAASAVLGLLCRTAVRIWMGTNMEIPALLIACMAVYAVVYIVSGFYGVVTNGLGMMNLGMGVAVFQGISNIPFSIFLAKTCRFGVAGVALGTVASLLLPLFVTPVCVKRYMDRLEHAPAQDP